MEPGELTDKQIDAIIRVLDEYVRLPNCFNYTDEQLSDMRRAVREAVRRTSTP